MSNFVRYDTAGNIVKRVLGSLSLPVPTEVSSATDATSKQMWTLLTECGQDLLRHNWQILTRTQSITTTAETEYALPTDFERYIDETGWNNTGRLPLIGPLSSQQWRLLQARQLGGTTIRLQYVIEGDLIKLYQAPTPAQTLTLEYISRGWVRDANDPDEYKDHPESDADIVLYRPRLMVAYLKQAWRMAKGFASTDQEYREALDDALYNDVSKSSLMLSSRAQYPYLGYQNMPDTGYGS